MRAGRDQILEFATGAVALSALVVATVVVLRFVRGDPPPPPPRDIAPVLVDDWSSVAGAGERWGSSEADIILVVFGDFECPACASFVTTTLPAFEQRYAGRVAVVYRHWPLRQHRLAYPAARAYECALVQGRAREMHDALYWNQRSLGLKPFRDYAEEAGIRELDRFDACVADQAPVPAVERDVRTIRELGGTGTPSIVVNGWLLRSGASLQLLDSIASTFQIKGSDSPSPTEGQAR